MSKEKPTTKKCKYCRTEIPYDAKICPNCRKKQRGNGVLLIVGILIVIALIGSCFNNGFQIQERRTGGLSKQQMQEQPIKRRINRKIVKRRNRRKTLQKMRKALKNNQVWKRKTDKRMPLTPN